MNYVAIQLREIKLLDHILWNSMPYSMQGSYLCFDCFNIYTVILAFLHNIVSIVIL